MTPAPRTPSTEPECEPSVGAVTRSNTPSAGTHSAFEEVACAVCDADDADVLSARDSFGYGSSCLVRCRRCGLVYYSPRLSPAILAHVYSGSASEYDYANFLAEARAARRQARTRLRDLERLAARNRGRLLDVGCGFGFLLVEARRRGWEAFGVEPADLPFAKLYPEVNSWVHRGTLESCPHPPGTFDVVTMNHSLEHLPDVHSALRRTRELLAPGGLLHVRVPNLASNAARWAGENWQMMGELHLYHFSASTLAPLLERHGYRVTSVTSGPFAPVDEAARIGVAMAQRVGLGRLVAPFRGSSLRGLFKAGKWCARMLALGAHRLATPWFWISWRLLRGEELIVSARQTPP